MSIKRRWCGSGCDSFSVDGGIRANWKLGEDAHEDGGDGVGSIRIVRRWCVWGLRIFVDRQICSRGVRMI